MKSGNIQSTVMRRVYYSYALSIVSHGMFWQGMFLGAAAVLLARWLHVASSTKNLLSTPVGNVPQYLMNSWYGAFTHGEVVTAVTFMLAGVVAVSAGYHIANSLANLRMWAMR